MWDLVADTIVVAHYNQLNTPHFTVQHDGLLGGGPAFSAEMKVSLLVSQ